MPFLQLNTIFLSALCQINAIKPHKKTPLKIKWNTQNKCSKNKCEFRHELNCRDALKVEFFLATQLNAIFWRSKNTPNNVNFIFHTLFASLCKSCGIFNQVVEWNRTRFSRLQKETNKKQHTHKNKKIWTAHFFSRHNSFELRAPHVR